MYKYEYIILVDMDEMIVPTNHSNWSDMIKDLVATTGSQVSWVFRNVYFFNEDFLGRKKGGDIPDIPPYLYMMQHIYRSDTHSPPGDLIKAIHDPQKVLVLHNHFPLACLGDCTSHDVDTSLGQMQHYRKDCYRDLEGFCETYWNNSVKDTSLWSVRNTVVQRTDNALQNMGFINE